MTEYLWHVHRHLRAVWAAAGLHTRVERLDFASEVVGRRIDYGIQLTRAECRQVLAALEAGIGEPKEETPAALPLMNRPGRSRPGTEQGGSPARLPGRPGHHTSKSKRSTR